MKQAPKPPSENRWPKRLAGAAIIALATCVAYVPAMRAGYIWDDDEYVTENPLIQIPGGLWRIWFTTETPQYYPMVFHTFWNEYHLWGLNPAGYHVINILLHIASALLVWRLAGRIGIPAAWFIAFVFAIHPVHVESVAWITERKNVLSGLFYLLALDGYLRFDDTRKWKWYTVSLALFVAALLSKSVTATLPVVLLLVVFYRRRRLGLRDLAFVAPLLILGLSFGLHTAHLERVKVGAQGSDWDAGFVERLIVACRALWFYAGKIIWPNPLIFVYPRWAIDSTSPTAYLPVLGIVVAVSAAAFAVFRKRPQALLLFLFCAVTLFPALGFINVYPHRFSFVADHFNYLGSLGFIIMAVVSVRYLIQTRFDARTARAAFAVSVVAIPTVLGALVWRQAHNYKDAETLWTATLRDNPEAWIAMVNLSSIYCRTGRSEQALPLLERAIKYPNAKIESLINLARVASDRGDHAKAVELFEQVLRERATAPLYSDFGAILKGAKRHDEAAQAIEHSLQLQPNAPVPWYNLARVRADQGRLEDAIACIARAIELLPSPEYFNFQGNLLALLKRYPEAIQAYSTAVERDPNSAEASFGWAVALYASGNDADAIQLCRQQLKRVGEDPRLVNQLAWMLATTSNDQLRNGREALQIIERLIPRIGPNPTAMDSHAAALAESGQFSDAIAVATLAIEYAAKGNDEKRASELRSRLMLYQSNQPYRHRAQ